MFLSCPVNMKCYSRGKSWIRSELGSHTDDNLRSRLCSSLFPVGTDYWFPLHPHHIPQKAQNTVSPDVSMWFCSFCFSCKTYNTISFSATLSCWNLAKSTRACLLSLPQADSKPRLYIDSYCCTMMSLVQLSTVFPDVMFMSSLLRAHYFTMWFASAWLLFSPYAAPAVPICYCGFIFPLKWAFVLCFVL